MNDNKFYSLPVEAVANPLKTDPQLGLSESEAHSRLKEHGFNELVERPQTGWPALLFRQFNNFLIITLLAAAVISLLLGEVIDASAIIIIVALNGILGVVQESKAEQALAALKKMAVPNAVVILQGRTLTVPAGDLVPGDLVLLEAGNYVPADVR
nr:cation-transporting P-type ATPase [Anaerolineae bacterium]